MKLRFRRRRENKTDYKARLVLLESNIPRLVIRKTNRYIITQIVKSKEAQDSVICSTNSKELSKYGWNYSLKNISTSYLTGYSIGLKAIKQNIKKPILDIGLQRSVKGSKIYAVVKGCIDAGLEIKCPEDMYPSEERIKGKHLSKGEGAEINLDKIKDEIRKNV